MSAPPTIPDRDRLPRWLFERYAHDLDQTWSDLDTGERIHWQEEADTVIEAVVKLSIYRIVGDR